MPSTKVYHTNTAQRTQTTLVQKRFIDRRLAFTTILHTNSPAKTGTNRINTVMTENGKSENTHPTVTLRNSLIKPRASPDVGNSMTAKAKNVRTKRTMYFMFFLANIFIAR